VICGGIGGRPRFPDLRVSLVDDPKVTDPYAETARKVVKRPNGFFTSIPE